MTKARRISYCTNVHAGASFAQVRANLARHATAVRAAVDPSAPLGIGLWLSRSAARALRDRRQALSFRTWLDQKGLEVATINAFPANDFHQPVVKHRAYEPDWTAPVRIEYTRDLADLLAILLPEGGGGSISTLPVAWKPRHRRHDVEVVAARHLFDVALHLAEIEMRTDRLIHLDLEPEPGCLLERSEDVTRFFEAHLLPQDEALVRRYLRVCHDVCHAAVMFEDQAEVLERYRGAEIAVGKIQISSALAVCFDGLAGTERASARDELAKFAEDRYLHQTVVRGDDGRYEFYEDLPAALQGHPASGTWRVHFHVPIFAEHLGRLETTQREIGACLACLADDPEIEHLEVETYAWDVLPEEHRAESLADGIARELRWLRERV